ncbi:DUF7557 family protein [Desulfogranum mediterraneum]|uniref:DUF7557 family protein n=1 Tax=Desulfogranum mediterraneum TaxID=160661 RepID=UPI000687076B|nr:hypothetical protein [Desulfogranum mediterraneum]
MNQTIKISANLYQRLGAHAEGFETPEGVIERLVTFYEEQRGLENTALTKPMKEMPLNLDIIYYPSDEESFKQQLLQKKVAYLLLHKFDGSKEIKEWNALNFSDQSSVNGNLRSGYLRDWQKKGIVKAEITTDRNDFN